MKEKTITMNQQTIAMNQGKTTMNQQPTTMNQEATTADNRFLSHGYLRMPKFMMEQLSNRQLPDLEEFGAFIHILLQANYKDEEVVIENQRLLCARGESMKSVLTWASLFGWKRGKTRNFFSRLEAKGLIRILPTSKRTTHIAIVDYEQWAGKPLVQQAKANIDDLFMDFWTAYHEETQMSKVNIGRARREWGRMKHNERILATERISDYYNNLPNINFCKQAATYLADKCYLNEYN